MRRTKSLIEAGFDGASLRRWRKRVRNVGGEKLRSLRRSVSHAHHLKHQLDEFLRLSEDRLSVPKVGADAFREGRGTDWSWRADAWRWRADKIGQAAVENGTEIGPALKIFHDCKKSEISTRQIRNQRDEHMAPFGMRLDVFGFDGSFMSIVLDLPEPATQGLRKNHLVRLNTIFELEKPIEIYARLNIKHGPNTEQLVRGISADKSENFVEFDMDMAQLNEKRIEGMWLDLIFDNPAMNQITLRELSMSRTPRSEF